MGWGGREGGRWRSFAPRGVMRKFEISRPSPPPPSPYHRPKKYNTAASHKRLIHHPLCCTTRQIIKKAGGKVFLLPFLPLPSLSPYNVDRTYTHVYIDKYIHIYIYTCIRVVCIRSIYFSRGSIEGNEVGKNIVSMGRTVVFLSRSPFRMEFSRVP